MTVLGVPGDYRDFPIPHSLPLCNQRAHMVKHSIIKQDGRPKYKVTGCDLMMYMSPLLMHVLSMRRIKEHVTSNRKYKCTLHLYGQPDGALRE